jgi:bacterioferritin
MSLTQVPGDFETDLEDRQRRAIVELLTHAYWMEIETVTNYIAASMSEGGSHIMAVRAALAAGVEEEVEHARALGRRIQELRGVVPGDEGLPGDTEYPQPPVRQPDVRAMIETVVATEMSAIRHYLRIIRATTEVDQHTNAIVLAILRDEQRHLKLFEGYLRQYAGER